MNEAFNFYYQNLFSITNRGDLCAALAISVDVDNDVEAVLRFVTFVERA